MVLVLAIGLVNHSLKSQHSMLNKKHICWSCIGMISPSYSTLRLGGLSSTGCHIKSKCRGPWHVWTLRRAPTCYCVGHLQWKYTVQDYFYTGSSKHDGCYSEGHCTFPSKHAISSLACYNICFTLNHKPRSVWSCCSKSINPLPMCASML